MIKAPGSVDPGAFQCVKKVCIKRQETASPLKGKNCPAGVVTLRNGQDRSLQFVIYASASPEAESAAKLRLAGSTILLARW